MGSTLVLRTTTARVVGAMAMGMGLVGVAGLALSAEVADLTTYGVLFAAVALVGWAAFWTPYVEVSDGSVVLRNVMRTLTFPWPSILEVEGRYGLRLTTAYGRFTSWAATAPAGRERSKGVESEAAMAVRQRLDELAAYLADPRLERERPDVRWHWPELAVAGALMLLALVGVAQG